MKWKFLKYPVLTLIRCLENFLAALSSQYRKQIPKKASDLALALRGVAIGCVTIVLMKTRVLHTGKKHQHHTQLLYLLSLQSCSPVHMSLDNCRVYQIINEQLSGSPRPQTQFTCSPSRSPFYHMSFFLHQHQLPSSFPAPAQPLPHLRHDVSPIQNGGAFFSPHLPNLAVPQSKRQ